MSKYPLDSLIKSQYAPVWPGMANLSDSPNTLYCRGDINDFGSDTLFLTVVGSRKISDYGREVCDFLIKQLKGKNVVIISGLALGTDACAHRAALEHELKTIAFPGSAIDDKTIYPAQHFALAHEILESGGLLCSEFEPEYRAQKWMFPKRNRLMAATSQATLIIEAGVKSGTLITAYQAVEQNKDVLVVPGSIFQPNTIGVHQLLSQGAIPVFDKDSLFSALGITEDSATQNQDTLFNYSDLPDDQSQILKQLSGAAKSVSQLAADTQTPLHEIQATLTLLEIEGRVFQNENLEFVAKIN